jgi:hypothetical protein
VPPSALDPGGGIAIFATDRASEEVTSCIAESLGNRLPKVRIAAGSEAAGVAFGGMAEAAPPGRSEGHALADPLQPEARRRLSNNGIRYIVTVSVRTGTANGATESAAPLLVGFRDRRSSEGDARVYEAASREQVTLVQARATGTVGVVAVFLIPIPFVAYTETRVCDAIGSRLGETFGGAKAAE